VIVGVSADRCYYLSVERHQVAQQIFARAPRRSRLSAPPDLDRWTACDLRGTRQRHAFEMGHLVDLLHPGLDAVQVQRAFCVTDENERVVTPRTRWGNRQSRA
jgi:hypothetical protein